MNISEPLKIQPTDYLPKIVNSVCTTVVMLAFIYTVYSYFLIQLETRHKPLLKEINTLQLQLQEENERRLLLERENARLSIQLEEDQQKIKKLSAQLTYPNFLRKAEQSTLPSTLSPLSSEEERECKTAEKPLEDKFLRAALHKTLSRNAEDRFEGFSILMNNVEYTTEQTQRELLELYLKEMNKSNRLGVYYAAFIMAEFEPVVLHEYHTQIESAYQFIHQESGWEKTANKYCQIQQKIDSILKFDRVPN